MCSSDLFSPQSNLIQIGQEYFGRYAIYNDTGGYIKTDNYSYGYGNMTSSIALSLNTWYHIAVVRNSGSFTMYIDGTSRATYGANTYAFGNTGFWGIGYNSNAYIDEIRISSSARYTTSFTPSASAFTNDGNTLALVHCDGTNGSTTFTNDAGSRTLKIIVPAGNAQISTAQSKFGGASLVGDGTGDWLSILPTSDFSTESNNFTYECWFRLNNIATMTQLFDTRPSGVNGAYPSVFVYTSKIAFYFNDAFLITGSSTLSSNTWYHMALVRNGNVYTLYIDGSSQGTTTVSGSVATITSFRIGAGGGNAYSLNGYIDEFRVSNTARYTTTFTPSASAFTNDANTLLLMHMNGTNGSTTFSDDNA